MAKDYNLQSPDGKVSVTASVDNGISWSVRLNNTLILDNASLAMTVISGTKESVLGDNPKVMSENVRSVDNVIEPVVPNKSSRIRDSYKELTLKFSGNYSIQLRAYNDGVAYRFITDMGGEIDVGNETVTLPFGDDFTIWFPEEESMISHYERSYRVTKVSEILPEQFASLPVYFQSPNGINVLFTESDLYDYPGMFLSGADHGFKALFPKAILETQPAEQNPDRSEIITKKADYIARTDGQRSFPWRVFIISDRPGGIVESNLVFQLARPLKLENTDWIKPGKVAWDWWNANNVYHVDFQAGINTTTYRYYIDFASKLGLAYIILDEGWSKTTTNLMESNPDIDVPELVRYGQQKGVGVILWTLWKPLEQNMEAILDTFVTWGAKGIKVDFMQRADQGMVNYYERVAREAAKRNLLVDYHGAFKPAGLRRAYPNVLSYEGVKGNEHNKWSRDITPKHTVTIPFIRMVAGPMDFTPGAMRNGMGENFSVRFTRPMSQGTRAHQVAMYVVYESPLQMMCDSPTHYYEEMETAKYISKIPVTWDETKVLDSAIGEYIVVARRKGDTWYIGAMTDEEPRRVALDFSFLPAGEYTMEIMQDGINARRYAEDYQMITVPLSNSDSRTINLAPGGGWIAIISEK